MTTPKQASSKNKPLKYVFALAPAIIIYVYRSWLIYISDLVFCLGFLLLLIMKILIVIGLTSFENYSMLFFCLITITFSIFAPTLIPEQIHLARYRSEYQAVVELARNHQLVHKGDCQYAYVLPEEYSNLSYAKNICISVEYKPAIVVEFEPLIYRRLLVYAETPEAVKEYISCGGSDGVGYFQLEENWYMCWQDWN